MTDKLTETVERAREIATRAYESYPFPTDVDDTSPAVMIDFAARAAFEALSLPIDEGVTQAALVEHFKRCAVAAANSGSDFNQGVVRGLEIAAAEIENGHAFAALRGSQS